MHTDLCMKSRFTKLVFKLNGMAGQIIKTLNEIFM